MLSNKNLYFDQLQHHGEFLSQRKNPLDVSFSAGYSQESEEQDMSLLNQGFRFGCQTSSKKELLLKNEMSNSTKKSQLFQTEQFTLRKMKKNKQHLKNQIDNKENLDYSGIRTSESNLEKF